MTELDSLKARVNAMEDRMAKIEGDMAVGQVTAGDLMWLSSEIVRVKVRVFNLENAEKEKGRSRSSYTGAHEIVREAGSSDSPSDMKTGEYTNTSHRRVYGPRQKFFGSEQNLGRYVMGGLALLLILGALGAFIAAAWSAVPAQVWFALLALLSVGIECAGIRFMKRRKQGFWSSVAALGAAMCLLLAAAGSFMLGLYPQSVTALLACIWFTVQCWAAFYTGSRFFYGFSCLGALSSLWTARMWCKLLIQNDKDPFYLMSTVTPEHQSEMILFGIALPLILIGIAAPLFLKRRYPEKDMKSSGFSTAFLVLFWFMLQDAVENVFLWADYSPVSLTYLLLGLSAVILYKSQDEAFLNLTDYDNLASVVSGAIVALMTGYAADCVFDALGVENAVAGICAVLSVFVAVVAILRPGRRHSLLLGVSPVLLIAFSDLSWRLSESYGLIPAAVALGMSVWHLIDRDGRTDTGICRRLIRVESVLFAFVRAMDETVWYIGDVDFGPVHAVRLFTLVLCALALTACVIPAYLSVFSNDKKPFLFFIETGFLHLAGGLTLGKILECLIGFSVMTSISLMICAVLYRSMLRRNVERGLERALCAAICWIVIFGSQAAVVFSSSFSYFVTRPAPKALSCAALLVCGALALKDAITLRHPLDAVLSVISANWFLITGTSMLVNGDGLMLSVLGVVFGAGFVAVGFRFKNKSLRISGLCAVIVYVLKAGTLDLTSGGSLMVSAAGLLVSGLVCFGISALYYHMNKKLDESERTDEEVESGEG